MDKLDELTPCHQYYNLAAIRQLLGTFSDIPQIACSDTAFHEDLAPNDRTFIWSGLPMGKRPGALNSGKEVYLIALLDSKDDNARAAVDYLVYRRQREIGSLATAMEGIDALLIPTPVESVLAKGTEQVLQDRANHNR